MEKIFQTAREKMGEIHVLVNNAGYGIEGKLRDTKSEDIDKEYFCAFANTITFNEACCKSHDRKRNTGLYGEYWICKSQSGVPD